MKSHIALLLLLLPSTLLAQNPLAIPPALDEDTFDLVVDEHTHQFYPGVTTSTYGVNGDFLGPTLIFHHGDTAHLRLINQLADHTSMHWHGMQVPGEMDGGPQRMVMPGDTWDVKYKVKNPAGTFWMEGMSVELRAVAKETNSPRSQYRQVLQKLVHADLVLSIMGPGGGFSMPPALARKA